VQAAYLLPFQDFVDRHLAALVNGHDLVDGFETRQSDVYNVIARAEHELGGRQLFEDTVVHGNLSAFGLGTNAHRSHAGGAVISATAENLLELAHAANVIRVAERPECRGELEILSGAQIRAGGFIQKSLFAKQDGLYSCRPGRRLPPQAWC
jgi:hypothetical protein